MAKESVFCGGRLSPSICCYYDLSHKISNHARIYFFVTVMQIAYRISRQILDSVV